MSEYDSPWKEFLDYFFKSFLEFGFRDLHDDIDWSQPVLMLDKELQKIAPVSELGLRVVDKLTEVQLKNGESKWLLIHSEVQSQRTESFSKRMFTCFYRISDKYDKPLVCLAVLGDDNPSWRPTTFVQSNFGCNVCFDFPMIKLLDYGSDLALLESSPNPFATVVLAHLLTMRTANEPKDRKQWKLRLMRSLYEQGKSGDEIRQLFRVIDWMMDLPTDLALQFKDEMEQVELERKMRYVTSIERIMRQEAVKEGLEQGIEQGIEQGLEQGLEQGILAGQILLLQKILGDTPSTIAELKLLAIDQLTTMLSQLQIRLNSRDC